MKIYLDEIEVIEKNHYRGCLISSIYYFMNNRNIEKSIEYLQRAESNQEDTIWAYNRAFISVYTGNIHEAFKYYTIGFTKIEKVTIDECTLFIKHILREEPDKVNFYYFLGLLLENIEEYRKEALENFRYFVEKSNQFIVDQSLLASAKKKI
jgi:tetratricopeptide (TPR) repeat protein